jgi:hypothetical protein
MPPSSRPGNYAPASAVRDPRARLRSTQDMIEDDLAVGNQAERISDIRARTASASRATASAPSPAAEELPSRGSVGGSARTSTRVPRGPALADPGEAPAGGLHRRATSEESSRLVMRNLGRLRSRAPPRPGTSGSHADVGVRTDLAVAWRSGASRDRRVTSSPSSVTMMASRYPSTTTSIDRARASIAFSTTFSEPEPDARRPPAAMRLQRRRGHRIRPMDGHLTPNAWTGFPTERRGRISIRQCQIGTPGRPCPRGAIATNPPVRPSASFGQIPRIAQSLLSSSSSVRPSRWYVDCLSGERDEDGLSKPGDDDVHSSVAKGTVDR